MPATITQRPAEGKLCTQFHLPMLERLYDRETINELISIYHPQATRTRKLTLLATIEVLICWNLFLDMPLGAIYADLLSTLRYLGPEEPEDLPGLVGWVYRRKQVGVRLMRRLFELKCKPLCTPETPGAFYKGMRLMAIDGTLDDVTDTKANAA